MKRWTIIFCLLVFVTLFGMARNNVYAIPGQLNYELPVAQPTAKVVINSVELNACNAKNVELTNTLKNCQDATSLLKQASDKSNDLRKTYLALAIISSTIAIILAVMLCVTVVLRKKQDKTTPPPMS